MEENKEQSSSSSSSSSIRRKKCMVYAVIFVTVAIFGTMAWFIPSASVATSPKVRLGVVTAANITTATSGASFSMDLKAEFSVKNSNLGFFSYRKTKATILYGGTTIGEAVIERSSVGARSTKRFNVTIPISSAGIPNGTMGLGDDLSRGVLPIACQAMLRGRVETMKVRRSRSGRLSCTMSVDLKTRVVRDLKC